jgi:hypothetical protein
MQINPENDKIISFELNLRSALTGALTPVVDGVVTAIITESDAPDAAAAAGTPALNAVYIGGANGFVAGTWMVLINGTDLTVALMAGLASKLYLIARRTGDIRAVVELENVASRYATVSS